MILVTGATGFLGSELVKQLVTNGKTVRALKRSTSLIPPILSSYSQIEWVDADLLDYFALEASFNGITQVYHCAALVSFQPAFRKQLIKVNKEGTANVVNLCLDNGVQKLVHVSSIAALGHSKNGLIKEKDQWEFDGSQSNYSISKYESEMEVWRGMAEGLDAVIVNPSLIIGANAGANGTGKLFQTLKNGLRFYSANSMSVVDVEDVAKAMILLMDSDLSNERFILNQQNISSKELFKQAATYLNAPIPSVELKPWMLELGWRFAGLLSLLTGKDYALTKETAKAAQKELKYSGERILQVLPQFAYKPINKTLQEIAAKLNR